MTRINVYSTYSDRADYDSTTDWDHFYGGEDTRSGLLGWFDYDKADGWEEDTEWDGNNYISVMTGSQWDHETLLRTAGGRWVLRTHSNRQGVMDAYYFMEDAQAREWLIRNGSDDVAARFFGEMPEEEDRRPGRPEVGNAVNVRLGDLLGPVDAYAEREDTTRAEALRRLVAAGLEATQP